jgi:RNA polymerase subunit RPABC4/transcription elongation factor Spt4
VIAKGNVCPVCKSTDTTGSFQGTVVVFSMESEIAKKIGVVEPGKYAIKV